jgi:putative flippase GtrA
MKRPSAFVGVGLLGFGLQVGALAALTSLARWHWLPATLASVEIAIVHNFFWHERWTWSDRTAGGDAVLSRFLRFNAANGLTSLAGNAGLMALLVGVAGAAPVPANVLAVAAISGVNFLLADRWVFAVRRDSRRPPRDPAPSAESAAPAIARAHGTRRRCGW